MSGELILTTLLAQKNGTFFVVEGKTFDGRVLSEFCDRESGVEGLILKPMGFVRESVGVYSVSIDSSNYFTKGIAQLKLSLAKIPGTNRLDALEEDSKKKLFGFLMKKISGVYIYGEADDSKAENSSIGRIQKIFDNPFDAIKWVKETSSHAQPHLYFLESSGAYRGVVTCDVYKAPLHGGKNLSALVRSAK